MRRPVSNPFSVRTPDLQVIERPESAAELRYAQRDRRATTGLSGSAFRRRFRRAGRLPARPRAGSRRLGRPAVRFDESSAERLRTHRSASVSASLSTRKRFPGTELDLDDAGSRPLVVEHDRLVASDRDGAVASISTGSRIGPPRSRGCAAVRASLPQVKSRLSASSCCRATSLTNAPRANASSTIRPFPPAPAPSALDPPIPPYIAVIPATVLLGLFEGELRGAGAPLPQLVGYP